MLRVRAVWALQSPMSTGAGKLMALIRWGPSTRAAEGPTRQDKYQAHGGLSDQGPTNLTTDGPTVVEPSRPKHADGSPTTEQADRTLADFTRIQPTKLDGFISSQLGAERGVHQHLGPHLEPEQVPPSTPVKVFSVNTVSGQAPGNQGADYGRRLGHIGHPDLLKPAVPGFVEPLPTSSGGNAKETTTCGTTVILHDPEGGKATETYGIGGNEGR